jgi:flagellin
VGLRIRTNLPSLTGQRHLNRTSAALSASLERLSSGQRINKAADDSAGLAISEKMNAKIRSLAQAKRNAQDGISLVQTAEGGLNEISNIVARLRELSVQAASDTIGNRERAFLQEEFGQLKNEIDRIASVVDFNGTHLLMGDDQVPEVFRAYHNFSPLEVQVGENYHPAVDSKMAQNPTNIIRIDMSQLVATTTGERSLHLGKSGDENEVRIDSKSAAQLAIARLDGALDQVSSYRSQLGAIQNRLQSSINNTAIQIESTSAAKSRIRDTDYAQESAEATQQQILQQSGVAVLSQAVKLPQLALKLLEM